VTSLKVKLKYFYCYWSDSVHLKNLLGGNLSNSIFKMQIQQYLVPSTILTGVENAISAKLKSPVLAGLPKRLS
jgi:hypothetical protein